MSSNNLIVVAAGGTGGHLFPAQALSEVLVSRGYRVHLMTDERVRDYGKSFPAEKIHIIPAASPSPTLSKLHLLPGRLLRLYSGYRKAKTLLKELSPIAVVGFGGYPSFPPVFAAKSLGIPTAVHEQNAVLGRANTVLAGKADFVATSFRDTIGIPAHSVNKVAFTGNPVRAIALARARTPYPSVVDSANISLVVFGGSQGANFFSDFMPRVFDAMPPELRLRIKLVQQCRAEDIETSRNNYKIAGVSAELETFFADMPSRLAGAHLVVCRAGASSIAELGVIGRPAALVPLPHAIDNDQLRNAQSFASAGAGWVFPQNELNAEEFAKFLSGLMEDGQVLKRAAAAALNHGIPDAAARLADLTINLGHAHK